MTKTVAVITSSTGRPELERAILSVKAQTYPVQHYVIVDGEQFADKVRQIVQKYPDIITVYLPMNTGANGKVNSTINAIAPYLTKEDYVCYLDDDNWFEPNHIESLIRTLENSQATYAYSLRNLMDKEGKLICPDNWESVGLYESIPSEVKFSVNVDKDKYALSFRRAGAYHIDTNCYFFPRQLALSLAMTWENGGRTNDKEVFQKLSEVGATGKSTGQFTVNYTFDYFKAFEESVEQWRAVNIPDSEITIIGHSLMKGLSEYALERYNRQPPWLER